jgi:hypothetical protein
MLVAASGAVMGPKMNTLVKMNNLSKELVGGLTFLWLTIGQPTGRRVAHRRSRLLRERYSGANGSLAQA